MPEKTMIIIGAGVGGLATGCYAQMNGYRTQIFEMHSLAGGVCTAWKRKGYTFDGCIHHLAGCRPEHRQYRVWKDLGAMPRPILHPKAAPSLYLFDSPSLWWYACRKPGIPPWRLGDRLRTRAPDHGR